MAEDGAHETRAEVLPAVAVTLLAVPGRPDGVTELEGAETNPAPLSLVALTVNVYASPPVRPTTVQVSVGSVAAHVWPPFADDVASVAATV